MINWLRTKWTMFIKNYIIDECPEHLNDLF